MAEIGVAEIGFDCPGEEIHTTPRNGSFLLARVCVINDKHTVERKAEELGRSSSLTDWARKSVVSLSLVLVLCLLCLSLFAMGRAVSIFASSGLCPPPCPHTAMPAHPPP